jgi:galactose mutarotase-like enzyme
VTAGRALAQGVGDEIDQGLRMPVELAEYAGFAAITVSTAQLRMTVVPDCGGKIVSLRSARSGREWLWRDPVRPLRQPVPGGEFARHDLSGWDECFPTIGACPYPAASGAKFAGVMLSDHGELWSRPWQWEIAGPELRMSHVGAALPYVFQRSISAMANGSIRLSYRVENRSAFPMSYLWSAHPLLNAENGMRICLPSSAGITKEFGYGGRIGADNEDGSLGRFDEHSWPNVKGADGVMRDLSLVAFGDPPVTDKVVVRGLAAGRAEIIDASGSERLAFEFPLRPVRYLGICTNYAAWPFGDNPGSWLALEPTSGGTDRLDDAVARSEAALLGAWGCARWRLELSVQSELVHKKQQTYGRIENEQP